MQIRGNITANFPKKSQDDVLFSLLNKRIQKNLIIEKIYLKSDIQMKITYK